MSYSAHFKSNSFGDEKAQPLFTCLTGEGSVVFAFVPREDAVTVSTTLVETEPVSILVGMRGVKRHFPSSSSQHSRPQNIANVAKVVVLCTVQGHEQKHNCRESICAKIFKDLHKNYNIKTKKVDLYEEFWSEYRLLMTSQDSFCYLYIQCGIAFSTLPT